MWILEFIDNFFGGNRKEPEVTLWNARCKFCGCDPCICPEPEDKTLFDVDLEEDVCEICDVKESRACDSCEGNDTHPFFMSKDHDALAHITNKIIKHGEQGSNGIWNATGQDIIENEDGTWEDTEEQKELDIDKVTTHLLEMSDDEFKEAIDRVKKEMEENKCYPDDCEGECQGMGWCDVAKDFRRTL